MANLDNLCPSITALTHSDAKTKCAKRAKKPATPEAVISALSPEQKQLLMKELLGG